MDIEQQKYTVFVGMLGIRWYNDKDQLHRLEGPALTLPNGDEFWYKDGMYHRDGGPACVWSTGTVMYYTNGVLNRTDGPAIVYADGDTHWYLDGKEYTELDFYKELSRRNQLTVTESEQPVSCVVTSNQVGDRFTTRSMFLIRDGVSDSFEPYMLCLVGMQANQCGHTLISLVSGNRWNNAVVPFVSASPCSFLNSFTIDELRSLFHVGDQFQLIPLKSITIST